ATEALKERNVEAPGDIAAKLVVAVVLCHADDLEGSPRVRELIGDVFADGILSPKIEPGHGFVDDANGRGGSCVLRPDFAAQKDRDAQSREVAGTYLVEAGAGVTLLLRLVSLDRDLVTGFRAAEQSIFGERNGANTGHGTETLEQRLEHSRPLSAFIA